MSEIGGAIISITLVMMLVFIPVSFMPGTSGVFYRQFGLTMAIAIGLSALNALTLSPALCAVFLKPHNTDSTLKDRLKDAYSAAGNAVVESYKKRVRISFPPFVTFILLIATIVVMVMGWFSFENITEGLAACAIGALTLVGLFQKRFHVAFEKLYNKTLSGYKSISQWFMGRRYTSIAIVAAAVAVLVWLMNSTRQLLCLTKTPALFSQWSICPRAHRRSAQQRP